jgi:hypothetical protein
VSTPGSTCSISKTVNWTGGDANGYVDIEGYAQVVGQSGVYFVGFECAAPNSAGTFTVPASILLSLPGGNIFGSIQVSTYSIPTIFPNVAGLNGAVEVFQFHTSVPVVFQ